MSITVRFPYHQVIKKPRRWKDPRTGHTYNVRGHTNRHFIFAISGGAATNPHGIRHYVAIKLHSCQTWKTTDPRGARASTEIFLGREEAEMMITALMVGLGEFDKQVAEAEEESA